MTMLNSQFLYSLTTAVFIGGICGYLGSLIVAKRMALVGDAFGHIALPGIALALLFGFNVSWGAFFSLFAGIFLIWLLKSVSVLHFEALTGIIFTSALAFSLLILPHEHLEEALMGDISRVGGGEALAAAAASLAVYFIVRLVYRGVVLSAISEDLAKAQGVRIRMNDFIYLLSMGVIVALGIKVAGALLVGALVVIPAAASRHFANNLFTYSYGAMLIGGFNSAAGIFLSKFTGLNAGSLIILLSALVFLISLSLKRGNYKKEKSSR